MRAVVLSAGHGTRLGELTRDTPKAMLPVGDRPLLEHVVRNLARHGFDEIAVNLHYRPETIRRHFGDGAALGVRLTYLEEPELLGTAGTLAALRPFLAGEDAFLVHYGDILTDHDFASMAAFHRERRAFLTLLVHRRAGSNSIAVFDADQRLTRFVERPPADDSGRLDSDWVNSGVCICDAGVLDVIPPPPSDLARDVLSRVAGRPDVFVHRLSGFRIAVDSPQRYSQAIQAVAEGRLG